MAEAVLDGADTQARAKLSLGAVSWAMFEWARNPYVILCLIYLFAPYVSGVVVGDPVRGQETIAGWNKIAGLGVAFTAPFLGASIDQMGRRKGWLALAVALMLPLMFALWWSKPDGSGLPVVLVMLMTTVIALLFSYTEVIHN